MIEPNGLAERVQRLEDAEAVRAVLLAYPAAVDNRDLAALGALFSPDAHLESREDVRGRAAVLDYYARFFQSEWHATRHYLANVRVTLDGDRASGASYYHQTAIVGNQNVVGWGTYADQLVRIDGTWLISEKVNHVLAMSPTPAEAHTSVPLTDVPDSVRLLREVLPDFGDAFLQARQAIVTDAPELPAWVRELLLAILSAQAGYAEGGQRHLRAARAAGLTPAQLREALGCVALVYGQSGWDRIAGPLTDAATPEGATS